MPTHANTREDIERWLDYQALGIFLGPVEVVFFRCGECRSLTGKDGQLVGTGRRDPNGVWWCFPRHFRNTRGEAVDHRVMFPLEPTGLFADLDADNFEVPLPLRCRRHRRPRLRAWLRSRAVKAWEDGYWVVHV